MIKLTHTLTQVDRKGNDQSSLTICVDYDPDNETWDCLNSIKAFDCKTGTITDITHIMFEHLHDAMEAYIDKIDWRGKYRDEVYEKANPID